MNQEPCITFDATFHLCSDGTLVTQDPGTLLPHTTLTFRFPNGAVTLRHKGTFLEIRREWDRHNTHLAVIPATGEICVTLVPFPPEEALP
jgi:hypothetical protein